VLEGVGDVDEAPRAWYRVWQPVEKSELNLEYRWCCIVNLKQAPMMCTMVYNGNWYQLSWDSAGRNRALMIVPLAVLGSGAGVLEHYGRISSSNKAVQNMVHF
jgi:hypothetical protein